MADRLADTAIEQDVVGNNDGGPAVLLQDSENVLQEVELFVTRARSEIVAMNDEGLLFFVTEWRPTLLVPPSLRNSDLNSDSNL